MEMFVFLSVCLFVRPDILLTSGASIRSVPSDNGRGNITIDQSDLQSLILYKLPDDNVAAINKQVNLEYSAMYTFDAMASFFDSSNNALPGCTQFFRQQANHQLDNARSFMTFLNMKGGKLFLPDIKAPTVASWDNCASAMQDALRILIQVRQALHDLHRRGAKENDVAFEEIASDMTTCNAKTIKRTADIVRQFQRASGSALTGGKSDRSIGEFIVDKELQRNPK